MGRGRTNSKKLKTVIDAPRVSKYNNSKQDIAESDGTGRSEREEHTYTHTFSTFWIALIKNRLFNTHSDTFVMDPGYLFQYKY